MNKYEVIKVNALVCDVQQMSICITWQSKLQPVRLGPNGSLHPSVMTYPRHCGSRLHGQAVMSPQGWGEEVAWTGCHVTTGMGEEAAWTGCHVTTGMGGGGCMDRLSCHHRDGGRKLHGQAVMSPRGWGEEAAWTGCHVTTGMGEEAAWTGCHVTTGMGGGGCMDRLSCHHRDGGGGCMDRLPCHHRDGGGGCMDRLSFHHRDGGEGCMDRLSCYHRDGGGGCIDRLSCHHRDRSEAAWTGCHVTTGIGGGGFLFVCLCAHAWISQVAHPRRYLWPHLGDPMRFVLPLLSWWGFSSRMLHSSWVHCAASLVCFRSASENALVGYLEVIHG